MREPALMRRLVARTLALAGVLAVAQTALSCQQPLTQLLVLLDTNIPECRWLNVHLRCAYNWNGLGDSPATACDESLTRGTSIAQIALPGSIGVQADETRPSDLVTLEIDNGDPNLPASPPSPPPTLRRIVRVQLLPHEVARMTIVFNAACLAVAPASASHPCPQGMGSCSLSQSCESQIGSDGSALTCGNNGTCRPTLIDPSEVATGADGGPFDSGVGALQPCDASMDAPHDAGDAGDSGDAFDAAREGG